MTHDVDQAIDEFRLAVRDLFADPIERDISLLQSRIAARRRGRKGTEFLQRELCEKMRQKIERELAA